MREQYRSITAPDKQSKCAQFRATWAEKEFRTYQELPLSRVVKSESIVGGSQARVGSTGGSTMKNRRFLGSGCLVSSTTVQSMLADGLLEPRLYAESGPRVPQERRQSRRTECRRDWLNGTYWPLARCAKEEGGGLCGWLQVKALPSRSSGVVDESNQMRPSKVCLHAERVVAIHRAICYTMSGR